MTAHMGTYKGHFVPSFAEEQKSMGFKILEKGCRCLCWRELKNFRGHVSVLAKTHFIALSVILERAMTQLSDDIKS